MQINLIADNSVSLAPVGFTQAVEKAAAVYEQDIPGEYTVNITYGWGTFDNKADDELINSNSGAFSLGGSQILEVLPYGRVRTLLLENAVADDQVAAVAALPATAPTGADEVLLSSAQEKALGIYMGSDDAIDGSIGFNTADVAEVPVAYIEEAALQEIGHALGWLCGYTPAGATPTVLDLYRFSAPGQYQWYGLPGYFSINDGVADLANYGITGDYTLFENTGSNDPFALPFTASSDDAILTSLDLEVLGVLGFGGQRHASLSQNSDFEGVGNSDVLWRDADGDVAIWNDTAGSSNYELQGPAYVSTDWQIAGVGDFNGASGDGILWRDSNGDLITWNAASPESFSNGVGYNVSTDWQVAGVGDFDGDGLSDILWRNANGDVDIWSANAGSSPVSFSAQPVTSVTTDWQINGVGDFNGVGKDGILWRNVNSGDVVIWNAQASSNAFAAAELGDVSADWSIAGVGDFTGGGQADILWRDMNGDVVLWTPNSNATGYSLINLGSVTTDWQIQSVGDYNGDGKADILWRNVNSGDVLAWESNASPLSFTNQDFGSVSSDWQIENTGGSRGLVINPVWDNSLNTLSAPMQEEFKSAVEAAISYYEQNFNNDITLSITFGLTQNSSHGSNTNALDIDDSYTYSQIKAELERSATSSDDSIAYNLLTSDPTGGGTFRTTYAEASLLDLPISSPPASDGSVWLSIPDLQDYDFNTNHDIEAGKVDAVGIFEHEISEVMGRIADVNLAGYFDPLDLFRYTANHQRVTSSSQLAGNNYFSIDGVNNLGQYDNIPGEDPGDWLDQTQLLSDSQQSSGIYDSYGGRAYPGPQEVSDTDLIEMDVLGWTRRT